MSDFVELVLTTLTSQGKFDSLNLSEKLSIDHQKIVGAVKSLQSLGDVISTEQTSQTRWQLTPEGQEVMERGSHEAVVFRNVPEGGIRQDDLMNLVGSSYGKIGFSKAMSSNWISIDKKADGGPRVLRKVETIEDHVQKQCRLVRGGQIDQLTDQQKNELKKRKLISEIKLTSYVVSMGSNFTTNIEKQETDLTQEMITSGAWKTKQFKAYNFSAKGLDLHGGHLHPLLKVRTQFRQIFLEMGFTEMPTNNFVESSFWNFDALFQPQQHPARDAHDTFFVSDPEHARDFPMEYMERVKKVHSVGGYGSLGYRYNWSELEASKNIMRTHTTAVSARMLYQLAIQPTFTPSKFFSIDRVFRNETLDATHLAEFHQIEGLVADYGLTLGDLMGYIQEFFKKYGIQKLKFKPAYNPYTEPSMEVFSYHEGLKKWVEIGNSGVFRPELLLPMNLPPHVSVIAWGLSLERPTMIKYGIQNIRDLFGPKVDLQKIYDSPICRLGS
ncbi:hypothetical protein HELRODRAFT_90419 [Helobdella robusta]|uniref:phenylalanine--tRNA ligase n=1 Tax=Helobdella robusta TaxID=6412 RepID=T1G7R2_HELRO|nr:hypothetical protein HELRODRAFT_90419 [Helobdella robusta]ESN91107.1 hypothetical protein HELRODRAFT_90419 [Helobdella robusta]